MITTSIAIAVLLASMLLVMSDLKLIAIDTLQAMRDATSRVIGSGRVWQILAFGALWVLIFTVTVL
ncbi:hypothetical protein [Puniceibacterium sediminis]|uniref:Uncharacterized protein n=1 Tax=Puniceibacterium sediminis TaxID=1608407 RepID=A0A238YZB0_9RHOB|nr:hypothetical protein [Puniceibacterium sediminis]SNR76417.1 hypothetical protein SAMN06265370_12165 [Puniceibacterium sediminis]